MRHVRILCAFPMDLGFRWTTTGKLGAQNFSRYNALYSFQFSPSILTFILKGMAPHKKLWINLKVQSRCVTSQPWILSCGSVGGSPCLWSLVYEIRSLNTALSQEVENSALVNLALPDSLEMIPRKLEAIMFQKVRHPWHPTCQDLETELNGEELADA